MDLCCCPDCLCLLPSTLLFGHLVRVHRRIPRPEEDPAATSGEVEVLVTSDTALEELVSEFLTSMRKLHDARVCEQWLADFLRCFEERKQQL